MTATEAPATSLIRPGTCRRCAGRGFVTSARVYAGVPGTCFACVGSGEVETDPATLAAARAAKAERDALQARWTAFLEAALARGGVFAHMGAQDLQTNAPERFARALASFETGRADLMDALAAHGRATCGIGVR